MQCAQRVTGLEGRVTCIFDENVKCRYDFLFSVPSTIDDVIFSEPVTLSCATLNNDKESENRCWHSENEAFVPIGQTGKKIGKSNVSLAI